MARVLIAGCGYVGTALGEALADDGHSVFGLRRRAERVGRGIEPLAADVADPGTLRRLPGELDFVFYTVSAGGREEARYRAAYVDGPRNLLGALEQQARPLQRLFVASSTAVHAQSSGEWVDESSPTEPEDFTGRLLLEGERLLLRGSLPVTVVRFGGIYGPGRTRLIESVRTGRAVSRGGAPRYKNRIHRDDCAGALRHLMNRGAPDSLYIGVDEEPADETAVLHWIAQQLGVSPPRCAAPSANSVRRGSNKRCRNARLLRSGFRFRYPTFREGYGALIRGE